MQVTIHPKDFSNFCRCLALIKDEYHDVQIQAGVLRQRSNDKASIFEMDLSPLIADADIILSNVKQKLPMLKQLSQQREVKIITADNDLSFIGKRSKFEFNNPRIDYLDNKFMPDEEFRNLFILAEDNLIVEYPFQKDICQLMKVTSKQFNIVSFQMLFQGDTAEISASTSSKDQQSKLESGIPVKKHLKGFLNIVTTPFLIDHDEEILLRMYNIQENVFIDKFSTMVGKVSVNVYCRSQLLEENQDVTEKE